MDLDALPGGDLIARGLNDLSRGEPSIEGLLVAIGGPRLRRLGFDVPAIEAPEHRLYDVREMVDRGLVEPNNALRLFREVEPSLFRYPAIDPPSFRRKVEEFFEDEQ